MMDFLQQREWGLMILDGKFIEYGLHTPAIEWLSVTLFSVCCYDLVLCICRSADMPCRQVQKNTFWYVVYDCWVWVVMGAGELFQSKMKLVIIIIIIILDICLWWTSFNYSSVIL